MSVEKMKEILDQKCYSFDDSIIQYLKGIVKNEKELRENEDLYIYNYLTLK